MGQLQRAGEMVHSQPPCGGADGVAKLGYRGPFPGKKESRLGKPPEEEDTVDLPPGRTNSNRPPFNALYNQLPQNMTTGKPRRQIARAQMTGDDERASDYRSPSADRTNPSP